MYAEGELFGFTEGAVRGRLVIRRDERGDVPERDGALAHCKFFPEKLQLILAR